MKMAVNLFGHGLVAIGVACPHGAGQILAVPGIFLVHFSNFQSSIWQKVKEAG
jgi:hypothetical protein